MTEKKTPEKPAPEKASNEKTKASQIFGKRSADFFGALLNQQVLVSAGNGQVFKGELIGVDVYDIIIQQKSGLELLIPKGNIIYIHRVVG